VTEAGVSTSRQGGRHTQLAIDLILPVAAALGLVALVAYSAEGPRGSDQFWYVSDLKRLLTHGHLSSNQVFPNTIGVDAALRSPPVHNLLNQYVVWPFARMAGAYPGWLLANLVAVLGSAVLLGALVTRLASRRLGCVAAAIFLALPLTVWVTTQPLAEATTIPFVTICLYLFVFAGTERPRWLAVVFFLGLSVWCRESFLPLLFLAPFLPLIRSDSPGARRDWALVGALVLLAVLLLVAKHLLFPPNVPCPIGMRIAAGGPGGASNMLCYFGDPGATVGLGAVIGKAFAGLRDQIVGPIALQPFFLPFNIGALGAAGLAFSARTGPERRLAAGSLALVAIHLATILVFQNQARYLAPVLVGPLAATLIFLTRRFPGLETRSRLPAAVIVVVSLSLGFIGVHRARQESRQIRQAEIAFHEFLVGRVSDTEPVLLDCTIPNYLAAAAFLDPRPVGMIGRETSPSSAEKLRLLLRPTLVLSQDGSDLVRSLGATPCGPTGQLPVPWESVRLFSMPPRVCIR
jgi:hypothetical protein